MKTEYLSVLLIIIALIMIVLGIANSIIPPVLTGIGFIVIAVIFFNKKS